MPPLGILFDHLLRWWTPDHSILRVHFCLSNLWAGTLRPHEELVPSQPFSQFPESVITLGVAQWRLFNSIIRFAFISWHSLQPCPTPTSSCPDFKTVIMDSFIFTYYQFITFLFKQQPKLLFHIKYFRNSIKWVSISKFMFLDFLKIYYFK